MDFLLVYKTKQPKKRIGSKFDGGYVIIDCFEYDLLLSCGIADDITFECEFSKNHNIKCIAFDGTIDCIPYTNYNIEFIKKNISKSNTEKTTNLINIIENNDNIFLKMDIESNEYQWLEILEEKHLLKFKQIVIEFHYPFNNHDIFNKYSYQMHTETKINCLKKLADTHYLVHFHANNCCGVTTYNNITVPNIFECTYLRKDLCQDIKLNTDPIPDPILDARNVMRNKEIYLKGYPFTNE
jgi:hypothetical protein